MATIPTTTGASTSSGNSSVKSDNKLNDVNTDDFLTIAEQDSGKKLDWLFELYLRQPALPKLVTSVEGNTMNLSWQTPNNMPFPMPIDVVVNGKTQRVEMPGGKGSVAFTGTAPVVDPDGWVLRAQ